MKKTYRYLTLFLLVALQGFIIALSMKAAVGVAAYDAFTQSISIVTNIKVGTIIIVVNSFLILLQLIILKRDFGIKEILQFAISVILGYFINLALYKVYNFEFTSYLMRLIVYIVAVSTSAVVLGIILSMNIISFPVEGFCKVFADNKGYDFVKVRMALDIIAIIGSLLISVIFKTRLMVREGTVIGTLLFSPIMGWSMTWAKDFLKKFSLEN